MIYYMQIPLPERLSRVGLLGQARIPNVNDLEIIEAMITREDASGIGTTFFDVRLNGASLFTPETLPQLGGGALDVVAALDNIPAPAKARIDFVCSILGAGGGGLRPTLTLALDNGQTVNGIPPGGLTGQVLKKNSNADFDTVWQTENSSLPIIHFSDDFNDNVINPAKWNTSGLASGISETGGQLVITRSSSGQLPTLSSINWFNKEVSWEYINPPQGGVNEGAQLILAATSGFGNYYTMDVSSLNLRCIANSATVKSITYDSVNHRWLRMRFLNGGVTYFASPDGITWTTIYSTTVTQDLTAYFLWLRLFNTTGANRTATFDNVTVKDLANIIF